jgi:hypothetical protein
MANIGHNALWGLLDWPQGDLIRLSEIENQKQSISAAKSPNRLLKKFHWNLNMMG